MQYAAADAACLLALLGSFIAAVGQPEEWPMGEPAGEAPGAAEAAEAGAAGDPQPEEAEEAEEGAAEAGAPAEAAAEGSGDNGSGSSSSSSSSSSSLGGEGERQQDAQQQPRSPSAADAVDLLGGCSLQQLQAAAAAWGVRLEISGARAVKRGGRRGQRQRREARRGSGRHEPEAASAFPLHVPFWDAQRQVRCGGVGWVKEQCGLTLQAA